MSKLESALYNAKDGLSLGGDTSQDKSNAWYQFSKDVLGPLGFLATSKPRLRLTRDHKMDGRHAVLDEPDVEDPGKLRTIGSTGSTSTKIVVCPSRNRLTEWRLLVVLVCPRSGGYKIPPSLMIR